MNRRYRVSAVFEKRDWGGGNLTWRRGTGRPLGNAPTAEPRSEARLVRQAA